MCSLLSARAPCNCSPLQIRTSSFCGRGRVGIRERVDPPRKGLSPESMEAIRNKPPPQLAYISCNPATLARDLGLLCAGGTYQLQRLQPVDFFPQTSHVECVALLQRA